MARPRDPLILLAWLQGLYFLITGLWPLFHMPSFLAVTGPKVDLWLVKTVGILIVVIGAVLILAARRRAIGPEVTLLAVGSAASLAGVDLVYALSDRIWDVYLLDALAETALVVLWGLWGIGWLRRKSAPGP
jgi:hypothetical protein